jgi:hypothetical protein
MRLKWMLGILAGAAASSSAFGGGPVEDLSTQKEVFTNSDCAATDSCHLKEFSVQMDRYKVHLAGGLVNFGTRMFARYQTQEIDQLEEFGLVQFIRGCQYSSRVINGELIGRKDILIYGPGNVVIPYVFPKWVIDGSSPDPIDWGTEPMPGTRHYFYKWSEIPGSTESKVHYFGDRKPTNPALFVRDLPGTAFLEEKLGEARNISVEFRVCLYKTADVPKSVPNGELDFATPLKCFGWNSSWIWDFEKSEMTSPEGVVPYCLGTPPG